MDIGDGSPLTCGQQSSDASAEDSTGHDKDKGHEHRERSYHRIILQKSNLEDFVQYTTTLSLNEVYASRTEASFRNIRFRIFQGVLQSVFSHICFDFEYNFTIHITISG